MQHPFPMLHGANPHPAADASAGLSRVLQQLHAISALASA